MIDHESDCPLEGQAWLRNAVAAAGVLTHRLPDDLLDRRSAEILTDTLARFTEQADWDSVTLRDIALVATFENREKYADDCDCGAFG
ncbi:hypothetical protein HUT18_07510 [Streptomyces sp. NA04227]|uniref:hypothetical protein n=1 Tax=Streptomyces sp. NA04227 TaxID=2742136 RepID=UPI00159080C3|nr:hypothetical protein [Streptomyces sp. NA04227]QKW06271.1 hypothetical protein HUT18_07510 [Streptomyces sp. NA04227]